MSEMEPSMRITLRDVYDAVTELSDGVSELRSDVRRVADREEDAARVAADHEDRLRALERRLWALPSLAAVLSFISVALVVLQWVHK